MAAAEAKLRRTASRGWVTRASQTLVSCLAEKDITAVKLSAIMDDFDKKLNKLDSVQSEYELFLQDEKELLADINAAADFREEVMGNRISAAEFLKKLSDNGSDTISTSSVSREVRLPKLSLPTFNGDVLNWQSFWDPFYATVDDSELPAVSKFTYLRSLLEGEAKQAIQGLTLSSEHYKDACDILKDRFGRRERIIFTHIQTLLNISVPPKCSVSALWKLNDDLLAHTRSLEALGIDGEQYGVILTPLILSRLPQDLRLEWSRDGEGHESDLAFLLKFLEKEIMRRERSQVFKEPLNVTAGVVPEERRNKVPTASALQTASSTAGMCGICGKTHPTERCFKLRVPMTERREKVRGAGLCFRCLHSGHIAKGCTSSCKRCGGRHHFILCNQDKHSEASPNQDKQISGRNPPIVTASNPRENNDKGVISHTGVSAGSFSPSAKSVPHSRVLLQTARVKVRGINGVTEATVLFDTGSDRSYVTSDLVKLTKPEWVDTQSVSYASFGTGKTSKSEMRNIYDIFLQDVQGSDHSLFATEVPVICAPLFRPEVPSEILKSFEKLEFADSYEAGREVKVDILIGLDAYWKFVQPQIVNCGHAGLLAQSTVFGWVVFGSVLQTPGVSESGVSIQLLCSTEQRVQSFWELESIGIVPEKECTSDLVDPVLAKFKDNVLRVDGRYQVALPWKPGARERLLNNEKLTHTRLNNLMRKLEHNPDLKVRYDAVINDMWLAGIIEEVPGEERVGCDSPVFYMPHRPVVRESAVSTKVRPVFDASAKGYNGVSLNDCMEVGPCLLTNLTEILLRFRRWKVGITADIEKAFLQIAVRKEDCDVHRFLWDFNGEVKVMRFKRVPFGNCSSPFLLNATIQHHLAVYPSSRVVTELQQNLYVDDFISGADSVPEACGMVRDASEIMGEAHMPLAKWGSSSCEVAEVLLREFKDKYIDAEVLKVLGMQWSAATDSFSFHAAALPEGLCITKRVMLSYFSRLFDPLGFAAPFIMQAKCLFQELWALGLQWDQELPLEYRTRFLRWSDGLENLEQWQIPRGYTDGRWCDIRQLQLHGFGDASPKGYGACVYLVAEMSNGYCVTSLVIAKSKVAPMKKLTLPRLELLGCLLCARLVKFAQNALQLPVDVPCRYWTDSMIALSWIRSDPVRWKTFVSNRVSDIQQMTSPDRWSHCAGPENPADLLTRGVCAEELVNSDLWLKGPKFLLDTSDALATGGEHDEELQPGMTAEVADTTLLTSQVHEKVCEIERWGTLNKAIRVIAWVHRFLYNIRHSQKDRYNGELSFKELEQAKSKLIQYVQEQEYEEEIRALQQGHTIQKSSGLTKLDPYLADDGLLRVRSRLQYSALTHDEKYPIIVPKSHFAVLLVRFQHGIMKHAGVPTMISALRRQYWIIGLRRIAKRVKKGCVACQRQDARAGSHPMPPLPELRVNQAVPFAITGLDHGGPLYCCDVPRQKYWVLLFTCAVIRAVHLELVESLSTKETLLALRRLAARRGVPKVIYSDNAKGFRASPGQLQAQFGALTPEWKFIAPRSPWWGGWWERLIRSAKTALKRTVGSNCLTRTELETTIHEVEASINSRPLTFVSDEPDSENPLTPSHFLLGHSGGYFGSDRLHTPVTSSEGLSQRFELRKSVLDRFWSMWSNEYIRNLPPYKGSNKQGQLKKGSLVLVQGEHPSRLKWPLGVITQVFPGKDGVVRTVEVKTTAGKMVRSVPRIHDLEIVNGCFSDTSSCVDDADPQTSTRQCAGTGPESGLNHGAADRPKFVTRTGRVVKPRQRLDL